MIRVGILSNPRSHRNQRGLGEIAAVATRYPGVLHREVTGPDDIAGMLGEFAEAGVQLVVLNGGDGTVQAALTTLFAASPYEEPPLLAVMRGGMTNMIALDVGLSGRRARGLDRLLRLASEDRIAPALVRRGLIRLETAPGMPAQIGMFFGTAAICRAIDKTRSGLESRGIEASAAAGAMLAGVIGGHALGWRGKNAIVAGDPIAIGFDGDPPGTPEDWFVILVTTLDRLMLRSRPYWGTEAGALRFTGIRHPPRKLLRSIGPALCGRGAELGPDYVSRNAQAMALSMDCPYTLDGELFTPAPGQPIRLSEAGSAQFVRL